eukprot:TRINITY_DN33248_c0_g1_i1.p2 TRINITY_DN33248_c0_g1~~TRINITY_DN33248_c0_g1_i1.p2  ORF type:complete len:131 (-),score=44.23 TRINITY_DN33248_c0_g1_i1:28-420(-)
MRVEIEDKERDARQRLSNFRQGREEIRCQLAHNVQKLANTIPAEMEAHTTECDELRSRIAAVEKARKDEARAWEDEKDRHQKEAKVFNIHLSLIHISEPTRLLSISYAVFCLKKKKKPNQNIHYQIRKHI